MKMFFGAAVGAAIGFAVGYFARCSSGTCPITRNPWISTVVGGLIGLLFAAGK